MRLRQPLFRSFIAAIALGLAAGLLGLTLGLFERSRAALVTLGEVVGRHTWLIQPTQESGVQPQPLPSRPQDLAALRKERGVVGLAMATGDSRLLAGWLNYVVNGVSEEYFRLRGFRFAQGRIFQAPGEAVVGHSLSNLLGQTVAVEGKEYRVVGVLEPVPVRDWKDRMADGVVYLPLDDYAGPIPGATQLYLATTPEAFLAARAALEAWLEHQGLQGYQVVRLADLFGLELRQKVAAVLGGALGFGLFAALLTAGSGLAAFYLSRSLEQVRQVGIRRAVGASRRSVLAEELLQSLLWVPLGFALGLPLLFAGNFWLERSLGLSALPGPLTLLLLWLGLILLVLLSALFPAFWASGQPPAQAVRGLVSSLPQRRLWLAGVGLFFGVAGLVLQSSLSRTAVAEVERLVGRFPERVGIYGSVFVGDNFTDPRGLISLTRSDYQALASSPLAQSFSGLGYVRSVEARLEVGDRAKTVLLRAYGGDYLRLVGGQLERGRWAQGPGEIALGRALAQELFGGGGLLGREVYALGRDLRVVGVFAGAANEVPANLADIQAALPDEYVRAPGFSVGFILAEVKPSLDSRAMLEEGARFLSSRYDLSQFQPVKAFRPADFAPPERKTLDQLTGVYGVLAVCLLVLGGAALAAQMLVGISLRRREIGIRRAVGASQRTIFGEFLAEALGLATVAGGAGVLAGIALTWLVVRSQRANLVLSGEWLFLGLLVGLLVALVFGVAPAVQAAQIPPAQTMREE